MTIELLTYDGIGNISRVVATRETNTNNPRPDVRRNEAYTPVLGQQAGTVIDQVNKVTDSGTAVGRSALQVRYGYDLSNRLVSVTRSAGSSETLDYGPSGELSHRRVAGKDVFYVGEYATVTASYCGTTCSTTESIRSVSVDAHLIYAGTRIASTRAASVDGLTSGRTLYYYRTRLGSVIGTSLREGVKGAFYRYTPYGEIDRTDENDTTRSDLGYTNALRLSGGLIHLVNRAYDPEAKVFVQADVVDRLRYAYVSGDPLNFSDPTGLMEAQAPQSGAGKTTKHLTRSGNIVQFYEVGADGKISNVQAFDLNVASQLEQANSMAAGLQSEGAETADQSRVGRALKAIGSAFSFARDKVASLVDGVRSVGASAAKRLTGFMRSGRDNPVDAEKALSIDTQAGKLGPELAEGAAEAAASAAAGYAAGAILQVGGRTLKKATIDGLNRAREAMGQKKRSQGEWRRALERLKEANDLRNDHHGMIDDSEDYLDQAGDVVDNMNNFLP